MLTFHFLLLTVVIVVAANAQQICDDDDDCYSGKCRAGVCFYPPSYRQLLVAANAVIRCRNSARCPEHQPYCVNGQCKDHTNLRYRLASYEVIPMGPCDPPCQSPHICNVLTGECEL